MRLRLLALAAVVLTGCGEPTPSAAPAQQTKLPPEVEHDPETATKQYQKTRQPRR